MTKTSKSHFFTQLQTHGSKTCVILLLTATALSASATLSRADQVEATQEAPIYFGETQVGTTAPGQKYNVIKRRADGRWVGIKSIDGTKGWVLASAVRGPASAGGEYSGQSNMSTSMNNSSEGGEKSTITLDLSSSWVSAIGLGTGVGLFFRIAQSSVGRFEIGPQATIFAFNRAMPLTLGAVARYWFKVGNNFELAPEATFTYATLLNSGGASSTSTTSGTTTAKVISNNTGPNAATSAPAASAATTSSSSASATVFGMGGFVAYKASRSISLDAGMRYTLQGGGINVLGGINLAL